MMRSMHFATIRLIVLTLVVISQIYLFVSIRRAIKSLHVSDLSRSGAIVALGITILLLFITKRYIMLNPITWPHPPAAARLFVFYLPAVWSLGSILVALALFSIDFAGGLGRVIFRIFRSSGRKEVSPINPGRRSFVQAGLGGLAAAPIVLCGYGAVYGSKAFEVRELALSFGQSLRVVQLSDIHLNGSQLYVSRGIGTTFTPVRLNVPPEITLLDLSSYQT